MKVARHSEDTSFEERDTVLLKIQFVPQVAKPKSETWTSAMSKSFFLTPEIDLGKAVKSLHFNSLI